MGGDAARLSFSVPHIGTYAHSVFCANDPKGSDISESEPMRKVDELTNPNSCLSKARSDEWTFVLLGRDRAACIAVRAWIEERIRLGKNTADDPQIQEAEQWIRTVWAEQNPFTAGDIVVGDNGYILCCGSGRYDDAIIVSVDPLAAVSRGGDMLWQATITPNDLRAVGHAKASEAVKAFARWNGEEFRKRQTA